jgi:hypothetical protein
LLLHVFLIIPSTDTVFICQNVLESMCAHDQEDSDQTQTQTQTQTQAQLVCSAKHWALVTSRFLLRQLSLEGTQHAFLRGSMSDYRSVGGVCLALSYRALHCIALLCIALPCLAVPCLALPCLASYFHTVRPVLWIY